MNLRSSFLPCTGFLFLVGASSAGAPSAGVGTSTGAIGAATGTAFSVSVSEVTKNEDDYGCRTIEMLRNLPTSSSA
jgi:hypothetical protein